MHTGVTNPVKIPARPTRLYPIRGIEFLQRKILKTGIETAQEGCILNGLPVTNSYWVSRD